MKTWVIGDIHGRFEALKEVLWKADFDKEKDKLIVLGDIVDGGYNTSKVVEELLKIKKVIYIIGNHDEWFMNHIKSGWAEEIWLQQGGGNTLRSYGADVEEADYVSDESKVITTDLNIPVTHQEFFNKGKYYHIEKGKLFVHGGFHVEEGLENTKKEDLVWDRSLIRYAMENKIPKFKRVFVGHTTTTSIIRDGEEYKCSCCKREWFRYKPFCLCGSNRYYTSKGHSSPIRYNNLIMMDCGAGWSGRLALMNIDESEYWISSLQTPAIYEAKNENK